MSQALAEHATQTIRAGSKSFAAASRLFEPDTRRSAVLLYAWCRHCDDVIDGQLLGMERRSEIQRPASELLAELEASTHRAFAGKPVSEPAFAAFQEVVLKHRIPQRYALDHLRGFAMDVEGRQYQRIEDTLEYCYHVAGVVGVMMAIIMGARDAPTLDRACDLGIAFQLTNIARDIVEDAAIGRCYLPAEWLDEFGIAPAGLAAEQHRGALAILARRLVDLAEPYYTSALDGLPALPFRSAWAVATAHGVYRQIGIKVVERGARAWDSRAFTTRAEKLRLAARGSWEVLAARRREPRPRPDLYQRPY
ncbi:phytoene/squalene synthase family protein [Pseudomonas sp.]|uniref:phytoene/squalene synthase family protein n=1 Tax=Pseudomonas sp. TaxID=306 RepID=UPI00272AC46F|nr:phytoene/squalene synthase family protein [Pseudomonas sp.]